MDEVDRASELEEARVLRSLSAIKREMSEENHDIECIDCGEEIEAERRRILPSARRCYICQEVYEKPRRVKRF